MSTDVQNPDRITMSQKERDTLKIMHGFLSGKRTQAERHACSSAVSDTSDASNVTSRPTETRPSFTACVASPPTTASMTTFAARSSLPTGVPIPTSAPPSASGRIEARDRRRVQ